VKVLPRICQLHPKMHQLLHRCNTERVELLTTWNSGQIKVTCSKYSKTPSRKENVYEIHLNGLRQSFNVRNARQLLVRYAMDKSVNLHKYIRSSACNPGQCSAMTSIDASVKFLHIEKYKPIG
jgi:hypothetical protein